MLKYLLVSLIPLTYQAISSHQSKCSNNGVQKIELSADYNNKVTYYNALCYNYKILEDDQCPKNLQGPYVYTTGNECEYFNETEDENGKFLQYHCNTKVMFDDWVKRLKKKNWDCQVFVLA